MDGVTKYAAVVELRMDVVNECLEFDGVILNN